MYKCFHPQAQFQPHFKKLLSDANKCQFLWIKSNKVLKYEGQQLEHSLKDITWQLCSYSFTLWFYVSELKVTAYIKEEFLGQFKFGQFSISFQGFANTQYEIIDFCNPIEMKSFEAKLNINEMENQCLLFNVSIVF